MAPMWRPLPLPPPHLMPLWSRYLWAQQPAGLRPVLGSAGLRPLPLWSPFQAPPPALAGPLQSERMVERTISPINSVDLTPATLHTAAACADCNGTQQQLSSEGSKEQAAGDRGMGEGGTKAGEVETTNLPPTPEAIAVPASAAPLPERPRRSRAPRQVEAAPGHDPATENQGARETRYSRRRAVLLDSKSADAGQVSDRSQVAAPPRVKTPIACTLSGASLAAMMEGTYPFCQKTGESLASVASKCHTRSP